METDLSLYMNRPVARGLILLPLSPSLQLGGGCRLNHNILLDNTRHGLLLLEQQGLPFPVAATCRKWGGGGVRAATVQLEQVVVGKPVVAELTHQNGRTLLLIIRSTIEENSVKKQQAWIRTMYRYISYRGVQSN
jgi:hypothetical protein